MNFKPNLDFSRYEYALTVVDSHTEGEFARVVVGGLPEIPGETMIEKKKYLAENLDFIRTALIMEPRGHKDMFGVIVTEPVHEEADFGVVFMEGEMFTNMCGHGTIATATVAVETGMVEVSEPYTEVVLDAPAGLIRTRVLVEDGKAREVTLTNVPSFLAKEDLEIEVGGKTYRYDISFGGQFFAMVDAAQVGLDIDRKNVGTYIDIGIEMMHKINEEQVQYHPELDITTVDVVEFYGPPHDEDSDLRNIVVFGDYQADRSPCGTGTSAKLALLRARGEIEVGETIVNESFLDTKFKGVILEDTMVGEYPAVIPAITGYANLTGVGTYLIDGDDPLKYGFSLS